MSRTFEISRTSIYDFIMQDICEKFNCYVVFDTEENTINFYAESLTSRFIGDGNTTEFVISPPYDSIYTVSLNSYKTTNYTYDNSTGILKFNTPPEDKTMIEVIDGSQEQWTTDVYVSFDNLAQEVNVSYSAEDIKTVLTVKGADDLNIREVNFGLPYIVDLSYYYTVDWMGQDLYDAYAIYLKKCSSVQAKYTENSEKMLELANYISYETNRLSLEYSIASNVSSITVGTYYVRGGTAPNYYYLEVQLPSEYNANVEHYYTLSGNDLNETKFSNFYTALQKYYNSGDSKTTEDIEKLSEDFAFMETHTISALVNSLKNASSVSEKDSAIAGFLDELWNQVGVTPLVDLYYEPYKKIKDTNIEAGWSNPSNGNYWNYYPVTVVLDSIDRAKAAKDEKIAQYQSQYDELRTENAQTSSDLLIANNFTDKQLIRLNAFLREDEYTDDNFVETDSDSISTIIQTKKELLECGKIELSKLCEPKLEFSMNMANIYALREFDPIIHQFQLGNLINVAIRDDYIKRARILQVDINFNDFSDFSCEFGELTNLKTPLSVHADLLANAMSAGKSVASQASYWNQGSALASATDLRIQQGLLGATTEIKAMDGTQGVVIDKYGIHLRLIDPNTGEIDPKEGWIVNNQFLYSDDNFKTAQSVFGEYTIDKITYWGLLAQAVIAGYIESTTIVGGTINIGDGTFVVASDGSVTMKASSIDGYVTDKELSDVESGLSSRISINENNITTKVSKDAVISSINQSAESITIDANKISLAGKTIDLTSDNIIIDSTYFSVTADGQITATNGQIANWTISTNRIYAQNEDGTYNSINTKNGSSFAFAVGASSLSVTTDAPFRVTQAGKLYARDAVISGTITAKDGSIAGYNIGSGGSYSDAIYKRITGDSASYEVGMKATSGTTDLAFYVKESTDSWSSSSNIFYINNSGKLYCENADITGKITASSGTIGGWNVGALGAYTQSLYSTYCAASSPSTTNPEYAVFMRSSGGPNNIAIGVKKRTSSSTDWTDSEDPFYVRKDGYVLMKNANITGEVHADSGTIDGNLEISGALTHTRGDYKVTLRGVQSTLSNGVFYITDSSSGSAKYPVRINGDGSASFTNVEISGSSTIAAACIPNLSASKITSGTLSSSRIDTSTLTIKSGCTIGSGTYNAKISTYDKYYAALSADASGNTSYTASLVSVVRAAQAWSSNNSSNKNIKNNIHDFDDRYDVFFDNLRPQLYKYNSRPDDGYSMGYIWQEVNESLAKSNLTRNDVGAVYEDKFIDGGLGLRKTDFIALNTWQIQKLKTRIEELENRLSELERNDMK